MGNELPEIGHTVTTLGIIEKALGLPISDGHDHVVFETRAYLLELMEDLATAREMESSDDIGGMTYAEYQKKWLFLNTPEELEDKKVELVEKDALAVELYNELLLEIERINAQQISDLVMLNHPVVPEGAVFTKRSAYSWLQTTFGIEIAEWTPPTITESSNDKPMRADDKTSHQLVIAALLDLFLANSSSPKCGTMEAPNAAEMSRRAEKALRERGVPEDNISLKTIENKISESMRTRKTNSKTERGN